MEALVVAHLDGKAVHLVVSGGAKGADTFATAWYAKRHRLPTRVHRPKQEAGQSWGAAALARNTLIVSDSDLVIAFVHPTSRGTFDTIRKAQKAGVDCVVIDLDMLEAVRRASTK